MASRSALVRTALAGTAALVLLAGCQDANASAGASASPSTTPSLPACLETATTCAVGDAGPGSGVVFYVAPTPQPWGQFLEAPTWSAWTTWLGTDSQKYPAYPPGCATRPDTGDTPADHAHEGYGIGAANTRTIIAACAGVSAAAKASAYAPKVGDGSTTVTGWYLPSFTETRALITQYALLGIPGDVLQSGLSSSTVYQGGAYFFSHNPYDGTGYSVNPGDVYILPIRAFGPTSSPPSPTPSPTPSLVPTSAQPTPTHTWAHLMPTATHSPAPPAAVVVPPVATVTGDPTYALVHVPSVSHDFTVTNTGGGTLTVGTITAAITPAEVTAGDGNPFSVSATTCTGAHLTAGQHCTVTVTVGVVGMYGPNGTLTVASNGGTSTTQLTASIT